MSKDTQVTNDTNPPGPPLLAGAKLAILQEAMMRLHTRLDDYSNDTQDHPFLIGAVEAQELMTIIEYAWGGNPAQAAPFEPRRSTPQHPEDARPNPMPLDRVQHWCRKAYRWMQTYRGPSVWMKVDYSDVQALLAFMARMKVLPDDVENAKEEDVSFKVEGTGPVPPGPVPSQVPIPDPGPAFQTTREVDRVRNINRSSTITSGTISVETPPSTSEIINSFLEGLKDFVDYADPTPRRTPDWEPPSYQINYAFAQEIIKAFRDQEKLTQMRGIWSRMRDHLPLAMKDAVEMEKLSK